MIDSGTVIAGTPKRVAEQIEELARSLNVGHLGILAQFGDMPHDKAMSNIRRIGADVLPKLRHLWDDSWEDHWWPRPMRDARLPRPVSAGLGGAA
jgi:hypothetical protein